MARGGHSPSGVSMTMSTVAYPVFVVLRRLHVISEE